MEAQASWKPFLAYVLPFILFGVFISVEEMEALQPWYPLLYTAKMAAIMSAILWGWRYYPAINAVGLGWGLLYGLLGGVLWIVLCHWNVEHDLLPPLVDKVAEWLNLPGLRDWLKPGNRLGYEPFAKLDGWQAWFFILVRLIGLVIVVPLMEEVFWRGFLNRIIIDENWQQVSWGKMTRASFLIITVAFVLVHTEWTAALVWVLGMNVLYLKTRSLWACVIAHAASNAVLGYYILAYSQWQLW